MMKTGYEPLNTLKPIGENIWVVDGPHIQFYGLPFSTRMTVIRLQSGELFIHSPIALSAELIKEIQNIGTVRHLVSPNWIHYAHIASWQKEFDHTLAWASPNVEARAHKFKINILFDRSLSGQAEPDWADEIDQLIAEGSNLHVEVVFFHKPSKTLILTDLIENFEKENFSWLNRMLLRLAGNLDPDGKAPIDMRLSFFAGKLKLRAAVKQMLDWAPEKIVLAHGRWYESNGVKELRRAFRWVL